MRQVSALVSFLALVVLGAPRAEAARPKAPAAVAAEAKLRKGEFDQAIALYRRHLRQAPKDFEAWSRLGAAYYHSGQPLKGLRILRQAQAPTTEKSFNLYYQARCYDSLSFPTEARTYYTRAARSDDDYGSRANFELGVLAYGAKDAELAKGFFSVYLTRRPTGPFASEAKRLLQTIKDGKWVTDAAGAPKPDLDAALFRYHKLSLWSRPHFWFVESGGRFVQHERQEPLPGGKTGPLGTSDMAALFSAGGGIGPWRMADLTYTAGYTYRQLWITNDDRIQEWLDDPSDVPYFPLRSDLLERHHQVYADLRNDLGTFYYFGAYLRYENARIGSSVFPNAEIEALQQVVDISDTTLMIPWIGVTFSSTMRALAYFYARREVNQNLPSHSHKTLNLDSERGALSFGTSIATEIPEYQVKLNLELFRYQFVYNDKFLDYDHFGFLGGADFQLLGPLSVSALLGYYEDSYLRAVVKSAPCSEQPVVPQGGTPAGGMIQAPPKRPNSCTRNDVGLMFQVGGSWTFGRFSRVAGFFQQVRNQNFSLSEYEDTKTTIQATYTFAFPGTRRVSRIVDRYADSAFTKDAE